MIDTGYYLRELAGRGVSAGFRDGCAADGSVCRFANRRSDTCCDSRAGGSLHGEWQ